jgi:hypothetical protein
MPISQPTDDRSTAQVVPIGDGKFGVIWNGELRPEKYPTRGIAYLAVTALRRHASPPTAPVDETRSVLGKRVLE